MLPRQPAVPAKLCLSFQEPAAKETTGGAGQEGGEREHWDDVGKKEKAPHT